MAALALTCSTAGWSGTVLAWQDPRAEAQAGSVLAAATFHYRGLSHRGYSYFLDQHLVVEVALSRAKPGRLNVSASQFHLRVNGGKAVLAPQPAGLVAYTMRWRWANRGMRGQAGPIILGGPGHEPRFPGDRVPAPLPRAPESRPTGAPERASVPPLEELLAEAALPEGEVTLPVCGLLYFPYEKKIKSIKKLELVYQGPEGAVTLRLR